MKDLQKKTAAIVPLWIRKGLYNKTEFAEMLGMSRPTLNDRIKKGNWRQREIDIISNNCPF